MPVSLPEHQHLPVLLDETVQIIGQVNDGIVVDATLGLGGHTESILSRFPTVKVIGIDQDIDAVHAAAMRLGKYGERIKIVQSNFLKLKDVLSHGSIESVDAIIADLGVSSLQFDSETRGFSFRFNAPLDMRMDPSSANETAADILATRTETEIADLIYQYGEERLSRRIARRIVETRKAGNPVTTTKQLADLVSRCVPRSKKDSIHPATRTFQALRIAVNRELEILENFLVDSVDVLKENGTLAVITFHSLEDRIVKNTFQKLSGKCFCPPRIPQCMCGAAKRVEILTRKPIVPSDTEMQKNPRSRSAKLRAVKKIQQQDI